MIKVQFFASIREAVGVGSIEIDLGPQGSVADILDNLCTKYPDWEGVLKNDRVLVALNQEMTHQGARVIDGDEVAFFPPVTGG